MPLFFLKKGKQLNGVSVDLFVDVKCIDTQGMIWPIFDEEGEKFLYGVHVKYNYLKKYKATGGQDKKQTVFQLLYHLSVIEGLWTKHITTINVPIYTYGGREEEKQIIMCYFKALIYAKNHNYKSIIIPLIASDVYGYPKQRAFRAAVTAIEAWLNDDSRYMDIYLLVLDDTIMSMVQKRHNKVDDYINNNYTLRCDSKYKGFFGRINAFLDKEDLERTNPHGAEGYYQDDPVIFYSGPPSEERRKRDIENSLESSFSPVFIRLIAEKGKTEVEIYKRANIDRKLFSKMRSNKRYVPSKRNVIALVIALELPIEEAEDMIKLAGYALSPGLLFDVIIQYFITNKIYDIYEINEVLFSYNLPVLGE